MVDKTASDLHLSTGSPPLLRIDGSDRAAEAPAAQPRTTAKQLCYSALSEEQKIQFEKRNEIDLSFSDARALPLPRQRLHAARRRRRGVPRDPVQDPRLRGARPAARRHRDREQTRAASCSSRAPRARASRRRSPASSTRSTREQRLHIITIEDPIEFLHQHKLSVVNQREVGADTVSFKDALKYALRQDPDVVLVGEMRDLETIEAAITIAETGHLVFGTLHTNSAISSINRIIDVVPRPPAEPGPRAALVHAGGRDDAAAHAARRRPPAACWRCEVMIPNAAIRNLIREDKVHQIYSQMQIGQGRAAGCRP
jgi:twitching motility protein PilT